MKWNWGTKIAIFYSLFISFTLFMVYSSFNQNYDLVTEDYYAQEIKYQQTIDSKNRANDLSNALQVSIIDKQLVVHFPQKEQAITGSIMVFRPSDQRKDFKETLSVSEGKHSIPLQKFSKGKYLLKVNWESKQTQFYTEQTIIIP